MKDRQDMGGGHGQAADTKDQDKAIRRSRDVCEEPDDRLTLARMISREIVPRLQVSTARNAAAGLRAVEPASRVNFVPPARDVQALLGLLLADDRRGLEEYLEWMVSAELTFHAAYREIIEPAASALGDLWLDDRASFFDVTVAVSRLHAIIHEWLETHPPKLAAASDVRRRIMLAKLDGEAHSLGLVIADCCFRSAGWAVHGGQDWSVDDRLFDELRTAPYGVLGLSVGSLTPIAKLRRTIETARAISENAEIKICVGGGLAIANEDICEAAGADFAAGDALEAVSMIEATLR